jgi:transcriptional regulator with XRE-family HTH domain
MKLKYYLDLKGIKQIEMAFQIGINPSTFNKFLNGYTLLPTQFHEKLCRALGCSQDKLRGNYIILLDKND